MENTFRAYSKVYQRLRQVKTELNMEQISTQKILSQLYESLVRDISTEVIRAIQLERKPKELPDQPVWLSLEEAKKILPLSAKKSWKTLRDTAKIDFVRIGRGFRYHRISLLKYVESRSTITRRRKKELGLE